jgi:hypothetical protein
MIQLQLNDKIKVIHNGYALNWIGIIEDIKGFRFDPDGIARPMIGIRFKNFIALRYFNPEDLRLVKKIRLKLPNWF